MLSGKVRRNLQLMIELILERRCAGLWSIQENGFEIVYLKRTLFVSAYWQKLVLGGIDPARVVK